MAKKKAKKEEIKDVVIPVITTEVIEKVVVQHKKESIDPSQREPKSIGKNILGETLYE